MSIQNAIYFTEIYKAEDKLRQYLAGLGSADEVRAYLKELDLEFTDEEFEEAFNLQVVKCADEVDHNILKQVKQAYVMLVTS